MVIYRDTVLLSTEISHLFLVLIAGTQGALVGVRKIDETAINHETKECIRFHLGDGCSSCDYTVQEGWVLAGSEEVNCPKGYIESNR